MSVKKRIALTAYGITGAISVGLGSLYVFSPTFMPYHAEAIGREWGALSAREQVLFGALLDVAGAGWIAVGVAVIWLAAVPIRRGEPWARLCAPLLLFIFYGPTLLATLSVEAATPASPPWWGNLTALTVTAIAFILDWPLGGDKAG